MRLKHVDGNAHSHDAKEERFGNVQKIFYYFWGVSMGEKRYLINRWSRASRFATSLIGIYRLMTKGDDKEKQGTTGLICFKKVDSVLP